MNIRSSTHVKFAGNSMRSQQKGFTLAELLVVITIIGLLAAMVLPAIVDVLFLGQSAKCQNNLDEFHSAVQTYRAANQSAPPPRGGPSEASSWGMFLKANGQGEGNLNNELFFCPVQDRTSNFKKEDYASDDGDYMFNVSKDGLSPLSSAAESDTVLAADCISRDGSATSHGDPSKKQVNILLKNSSIQKAGKGDDLFKRALNANMVGGSNTKNTTCPPPTASQNTQQSAGNQNQQQQQN